MNFTTSSDCYWGLGRPRVSDYHSLSYNMLGSCSGPSVERQSLCSLSPGDGWWGKWGRRCSGGMKKQLQQGLIAAPADWLRTITKKLPPLVTRVSLTVFCVIYQADQISAGSCSRRHISAEPSVRSAGFTFSCIKQWFTWVTMLCKSCWMKAVSHPMIPSCSHGPE